MNTAIEIVMVVRERYEPTLDALDAVLRSTPPDVGVVLVPGGWTAKSIRRARILGGDRVRIVGPRRHLAPNAARRIGLRSSCADLVVFVDNDIRVEEGWLEPLIDAARTEDAWVVRPIVLQDVKGRVSIHESGGDCRLDRIGGSVKLVESHRHAGRTLEDIGPLSREVIEMFEFHTVLFDRQRLVDLGGPDQRMLAQGDHLDLALRVRDAGGQVWLEPASRVTYDVPSRIRWRDLSFFLGRWSPRWNSSSRDSFAATHGIDPDLGPWTWSFADRQRRIAWSMLDLLWARMVPRAAGRKPAERFDSLIGRRLADFVLVLDPRWRGGGLDTGD